jgi:hypothetical protein
MFLKWMAVLMLAACLQAEQPVRPTCNREHRGQLWPEQKSKQPCRAIEICTMRRLRYRWEPLTVHVSQLPRDPKRKGACDAGEQKVADEAAEGGGK